MSDPLTNTPLGFFSSHTNSVAVVEDYKMIPSDFPRISPELIKALDALYPERCPEPQWSDREIWMRVGERRVVRTLQRIFDEQNRNILEEKLNVLESTQDATAPAASGTTATPT